MPRTSGRPITAIATRDPRSLIARGLPTAEATPSACIVLERGTEILAAEVGPQLVDEHELGVGRLPEQEVRDPQLAGRTDQQIGVRQLRLVEEGREPFLVEPRGINIRFERAPRSSDDLCATAVVERDPQLQALLV